LLETIFDPNNYPFWILLISILVGAIVIISRPFSTYVKFVYPNAKFEAVGNPFITEKELSKAVESKTLDDFIENLNSNKDYDVSGENILELQKSLDFNLFNTIEMMKKDSSKKMDDFYKSYLEKLDYYLIKNTIKEIMQDKEIDGYIIEKAYLKKTKDLLQNIMESDKNKLPQVLKDNNFPDNVIELIKKEEFEILNFDIQMDKFILNNLKQIKVPYKCEIGKKKFVNYLIDTLNIKNVLRSKQIGFDNKTCTFLFLGEGQEIAEWKFNELCESDSVSQAISSLQGTSYYEPLKNSIEEYNKENSVQILENALDANFLKLIKDVSLESYVTIGPTIRYLISKEFEIKNLKIIVKGISENLPSEEIKKLLIREASS
jgi:V/A-type H+-transporting ATPase subunit C